MKIKAKHEMSMGCSGSFSVGFFFKIIYAFSLFVKTADVIKYWKIVMFSLECAEITKAFIIRVCAVKNHQKLP